MLGLSILWFSWISIGKMFLGGLWSAGERSEPSGTARPETFGYAQDVFVRQWRLATITVALVFLSAFLASARSAGGPAQGTLVARASSFNPRTTLGQSGAQLEPRALCDPNSNRCLSGGPGRELACIRMSLNTFSACVRK